MEALVVFVGLSALAFLAMRYGYDSNYAVYSKEEEMARLGMVWDPHLLHLGDLRREAALSRRLRQINPAFQPTFAGTGCQRAMTSFVSRTIHVCTGSLLGATARRSAIVADSSISTSNRPGVSTSTWSES